MYSIGAQDLLSYSNKTQKAVADYLWLLSPHEGTRRVRKIDSVVEVKRLGRGLAASFLHFRIPHTKRQPGHLLSLKCGHNHPT